MNALLGDDILKKTGTFDITPVGEYDGVLYKRDDLFCPFLDCETRGGKVRQALVLFKRREREIRTNHNSGVITATSVHSPQGLIISRVAREFGFKCIVAVGGTNDAKIREHYLMRECLTQGADVRNVGGLGYNSLLYNRIDRIVAQNGYFVVRFGINLDTDPEAILGSVAEQVQNLPNDLDNLIIPVGSGIMMGGIIHGLHKYGIRPKRVIGVQVGANRRKVLYRYAPPFTTVRFELVKVEEPYSKHLEITKPFLLDPIYESKAFKWMMENIDVANEKTMYWVVGIRPFNTGTRS